MDAKEIEELERRWCDLLLDASQTQAAGGDAGSAVDRLLSEVYAFDECQVMIKPTLGFGDHTFRTTRAEARSYFLGNDPGFPEDVGFATLPWKAVRFENRGVLEQEEQVVVMANFWFERAEGGEVMVDKTLVLRMFPDQKLRIVAHHSSIPYCPEEGLPE